MVFSHTSPFRLLSELMTGRCSPRLKPWAFLACVPFRIYFNGTFIGKEPRGLFFGDSSDPIRVASPCLGLDSPCRATRALGMPWRSTNMYDIRADLRPALEQVHGPDARMHLGPRAGDISLVDVNDLEDSDALVSGPPCPPFSAIGKRMASHDHRTTVFFVVLQWVSHLTTFLCLKMLSASCSASEGWTSPTRTQSWRLSSKRFRPTGKCALFAPTPWIQAHREQASSVHHRRFPQDATHAAAENTVCSRRHQDRHSATPRVFGQRLCCRRQRFPKPHSKPAGNRS